MDKIASKKFTSNSTITCEPTTHTHAECRVDESEIYNQQQIQLLNNKFVNGILGVCLTWLDCKILK